MRGITRTVPAALRVLCALLLALSLITACDSPTGGETETETETETDSGKKPGSGSGGSSGGVGGTTRYTITFNTHGGSEVASITKDSGTRVDRPPNPVRVGYVFLGWYSAETGGTAYTWPHTPSTNVTMHARWLAVISTAAGITSYLNAASGGTSVDAPVPLPVDLNLANDWAELLTKINTAGKYVALDLSACDMSGTEFDPGANSTGADKIVSLVLPDAAVSVKADYSDDGTFRFFTRLTSVSGENVETIGWGAFFRCTALTTVSLPEAQTIGEFAFFRCTALTTVNLPEAQTIDEYAFYGCTALTTVSLPEAQTIGPVAFAECTALTTVSLPGAQTIGEGAFSGCTALTTVDLPVAQTIGGGAFHGCTSLMNITIDSRNPTYRAQGGMLLSKDGATLIVFPAAGTGTGGAVTLPGIIHIGEDAFSDCTALTTVNLPEAQTIDEYAFSGCTALTTVNLPAVTAIGEYAFSNTYNRSLTVTLGAAVPTLGRELFYYITDAKSVTVRVPAGEAAWSGIVSGSPYQGTDTADTWGTGFRGGGWNGSGMTGGPVNSNISLTVETYTP